MNPRQISKLLFEILLLSFLFTSCKKESPEPININLLFNEWKVVEQKIKNTYVSPLLAKLQFVNASNGELSVVNINFEESFFVFDSSHRNSSMHSKNYGSFSSKWDFDTSKNELNINSFENNDTTWNQTVKLNGYYYGPYLTISRSYKVESLTSTQLELTYSDVYIKLKPK